ncbi:MAG: archease [Candidatus Diapherotrites archaeon]|nr:archease [Candidatus Diapherotrites archaeon]
MPFRFLDHTADVLVEVDAPTFEKLLAEAGRALFAAMLDVDKVQPVVQTFFSVSAKDEADLLYNFLEELLVYKDADALAFSRFSVDVKRGEQLTADVIAEGERITPGHNPRADVKAISWHDFRVWRDENGWHARILMDV